MTPKLKITPAFEKLADKVTQKYPKSREAIHHFITVDLMKTPEHGNNYPGFGQSINVKKTRIPLVKYKISKRDGLRLIYLYPPDKKIVIPLILYKKNQYKAEKEIKAMVRTQLKKVFEDMAFKK